MMSEEGRNDEGYDNAEYYEEENKYLPEEFYNMKWPSPKLRDNRPIGSDKALVWFLNFYKDMLQEKHNIDVRSLAKKQRYNMYMM